jgi:hypothetical protein
MKRHVRDNHGTGNRPWACPSCSYASARKDNLKKHMTALHGKDWGTVLYDAAREVSSDEEDEGDREASGVDGEGEGRGEGS